MASTDARPIPQRGVAYRVTFPVFDADGDLVLNATFTSIGGTANRATISKDGAAGADSTNAPTFITSSGGLYFLDLSASEMTADTVAVTFNVSAPTGAKATPVILYPEEAGDIRVNVTQWLNQTALADVNGAPRCTISVGTGTGQVNISGGRAEANLVRVLDVGVGAVNIAGENHLKVDSNSWRGTQVALPTVAGVPKVDITHVGGAAAPALVGGRFDASVGAMAANTLTATAIQDNAITAAKINAAAITSAKFAAGAIDAAAIATNAIDADAVAADAVTELQAGLATAANLSTANTALTNIQSRLPAALSGGKMDSVVSGTVSANVVSMAADVITASAIASAAFTNAEFAATALQAIADEILDRANSIETGLTLRQAIRLIASACAGKASGLGTTTAIYRNVGDTKDRITATVSPVGDRTAVTTDAT